MLIKLLSNINDFKVQKTSNNQAQPLVGEAVRSETFEELGEHGSNNKQQTCLAFEQIQNSTQGKLNEQPKHLLKTY